MHQSKSYVLQGSQDIRQDSKDFKAAVARTRQAVSVQKAIGFMDASSPAKYLLISLNCCMAVTMLSRVADCVDHAGP